MSDNALKTSFGKTNTRSNQMATETSEQVTAKSLPVSIVKLNSNQTAATLKFETETGVMTMPQIESPLWLSRYYRIPYAVGDKGILFSARTSITPATGNGPQVAPFVHQGNVSGYNQLFHGAADTAKFPPMIDANANEHTAPVGHYSHDDDNKALLKIHTSDGTSISGGGSSPGVAGPQKFHAKHDGSTEHTADGDHSSTVGGDNTQAANNHVQIASGDHTITAGGAHIIDAVTNVQKLLSALGGLNIPTGQSLEIPAGSISAADLASGAAAANVGTLGGDLSGTLPDPEVVRINNVDASSLHIYATNALARSGGVPVGGLYINNTISGTEQVLCVAF